MAARPSDKIPIEDPVDKAKWDVTAYAPVEGEEIKKRGLLAKVVRRGKEDFLDAFTSMDDPATGIRRHL